MAVGSYLYQKNADKTVSRDERTTEFWLLRHQVKRRSLLISRTISKQNEQSFCFYILQMMKLHIILL